MKKFPPGEEKIPKKHPGVKKIEIDSDFPGNEVEIEDAAVLMDIKMFVTGEKGPEQWSSLMKERLSWAKR